MERPRVRRIQAGGLGFSMIEDGVGGRPLLLEHGFCGAKEDFGEVVPGLAGMGWHVIAPDLRGHGSSDHPPGSSSYNLGTFAADLLAIADAMRWPSMTLLGHSMGGMVSQIVAIEHAERLDGLILMDTGHGPVKGLDPDMMELGRQIVRDQGLPALVEALRLYSPLNTPAHERMLRERPGFQEFTDNKTLSCSRDMWLAVASEMLEQQDRLASLRSLSVPTLVIVGEQDAPFLEDSARMAEAIPGARLAVVPEAGHSPQVENPEAWWGVVTPFLERLMGSFIDDGGCSSQRQEV